MRRALAAGSALLALAACGAGGGPPPLPPPVPAEAPLAPDARAEIEAARAAVLAAPSDPGARLAHAARLEANDLSALALPAYEAAAALAPRDARPRYHAARLRAELGDAQGALRDADAALALEPGYAPGHRRRGALLLEAGRIAEAEAALRRAHDLDPRDPGAALLLARAALERGAPEDALRLADAVLAGAPDLPYGHHLRAAALRELGRAADAEGSAARADGRAPAGADPWENEVRALRGGPRMLLARANALIEAGRAQEAADLLAAELPKRPDDVGVIGALASALCALARFDEARALVAGAERRLPRHNRLPLIASEVHAATGDLDAAVESARRAIALQADFALAHERLAALLAARGDAAEAAAVEARAARLAGRGEEP